MSQLRTATLVSEGEKAESNPKLIPQPSRPPPPLQTAMLVESGNSEGSVLGYATIEDQRGPIEAELHGYEFEDSTLARRAFRNITQTDAAIENFIQGSDLYDKGTRTWALPLKPSEEKVLYSPLVAVINSINVHFGLQNDRAVRHIHNTKLPHVEGSDITSQYPDPPAKKGSSGSDESNASDPDYSPAGEKPSASQPTLKSSPDICVQAVVPNNKDLNNFPCIENANKHPSYRMTVSAIEVKTEKNFDPKPNLIQVAVYARQIFIQQGNRRLVNCFIVTEKHVRVYIFGRDGLHYSTKVDIHEDPETFVRFMLGALSLEADVVGFDPTIYYQDGRRHVQTVDLDGNEVVYTLVHERPVFYRRTIRGRGTTCWMVQNEDGDIFIVKDGWKALGRVHESEFLKMVEGIDGVGQMLGYQDRLAVLSELRLIDLKNMTVEMKNFWHDRELCRVVLEYYGRSLEGFRSRGELLAAYHDALCGYKNLYERGILHRDVSVNNLLIGKLGDPAPNRGVIIDLDMAIELDRTSSLFEIDFKTGTRAFQSLNILQSYEHDHESKPHSYMDDLESFFYILCWICCGYDGPAKRTKRFGTIFAKWEDRRPQEGALSKKSLFYQFFPDQKHLVVTDYFGDIFVNLVDSLHAFLRSYLMADPVLRVRPSPPTLDEALETILPLINTAIAAVEAEEAAESYSSTKTEDTSPATLPEPKDPDFTLMEPPARYNRDSPAPKRSHSESSGGESSSSTATKRLRSKRTVQYKPSALSSSSLADHGA